MRFLPILDSKTDLNSSRENPVPDTITHASVSSIRCQMIGQRTSRGWEFIASTKAPICWSPASWASSNTQKKVSTLWLKASPKTPSGVNGPNDLSRYTTPISQGKRCIRAENGSTPLMRNRAWNRSHFCWILVSRFPSLRFLATLMNKLNMIQQAKRTSESLFVVICSFLVIAVGELRTWNYHPWHLDMSWIAVCKSLAPMLLVSLHATK